MMEVTPLRALLTVVAGVLTGLLSGVFGVGGAVVSTPAVRLLGVSALLAVGTTLPPILPGALAGTFRYVGESLVSWRVVAWTAPFGIAASAAGSRLSRAVPGRGHVLMVLTAALLGYAAWRAGSDVRRASDDADPGAAGAETPGQPGQAADPGPEAAPRRDRPAVLVAVGAAAGLLSGLLGVGGGVVLVPGFSEVARLPIKEAIATSLACVGIFGLASTLAHWSLGGIDWPVAGLLSVGVIPGARLGAVAAIRADTARLRLALAWFLGVLAVVYATLELLALRSD